MDPKVISIISLFLSALSIAVTILIFYLRINKKLKYIIESREDIVSHKQANELAQLYIHMIKEKLKYKTKLIILEQYNKEISNTNKVSLHGMITETINITTAQIRNLFAGFTLFGGKSFQEFTRRLVLRRKANQKKANKVAIEKIDKILEENKTADDLISEIISLIEIEGDKSHKEIIKKLDKIYNI